MTYMTGIGKDSSAGFSLVELAISVTIIGILIAAVVKGNDVLENARVATTVSTVKGYQVSADSFKELYGAYPGDVADTVPGCNTTCAAGDADGEIEAEDGRNPDWDFDIGEDDEAVQFWKHLAAAEMISDVRVTAEVDDVDEMAFGVTHPKSSFGGGFDVFYDSNFQPDGVSINQVGHFMRLSGGAPPLKPLTASAIDRKMDDGYPYTGKVMAAGGGNCVGSEDAAAATLSTGIYDRAVEQKTCVMFFKFGGRRG